MPSRKLAAILILFGLLLGRCAKQPTSQLPLQAHTKDGQPVILHLVARDRTLTISKGENGPVYSVADMKGKMLLSQGTRDDLRRQHPDLSHMIDNAIVTSDMRNVPDRAMPAQMTPPIPSISADGPLMLRRD